MKIVGALISMVLLVSVKSGIVYAASQEGAPVHAHKSPGVMCQQCMQEFITPNANHELLRTMEGSWNAEIAFRATMQNPVSTSQATVEARMILGGRYLERILKGRADNFEARIVSGHDNFRGEYTSIWFDNMCTGMITGAGHYDPSTKTITEEGSMSCPMTDQARRWFRSTTRIIDEDHYVFEMFKRDEEGEEFNAMTIEYARVK